MNVGCGVRRRGAAGGAHSHTKGGGVGQGHGGGCGQPRGVIGGRWRGNADVRRPRTAAVKAESGIRRNISGSILVHIRGGGVVSFPAADAAVVVAWSAARRRMSRRKEDMCSAEGGAVTVGTGSVSIPITVPTAEAAVAVVPAAVPTVTSGERETARVAAADAVGIAMPSAAGGGIIGKWETELPPALVPRRGSTVGAGPAPRWDVPVEERGQPSETEVMCTLIARAGRPSETEAMGSPGARTGATP